LRSSNSPTAYSYTQHCGKTIRHVVVTIAFSESEVGAGASMFMQQQLNLTAALSVTVVGKGSNQVQHQALMPQQKITCSGILVVTV